MRIALVHDYLTQYGGAERVLEVLYRMYADSSCHVHTSIRVPEHLPDAMRDWPITTSPIGRLPLADRTHRAWLPLYPALFRKIGAGLTDADVVIADTSAWAHHAHPPGDIPLVVYCHSPARFLHGDAHYLGAARTAGLAMRGAAPLIRWLREQDVAAAQRADRIVASSAAVRSRIARVWARDADVIHPPVDTARFAPDGESEPEAGHLVVSRLVPHKWIDRAIDASNRTGLPLTVIGSGRSERGLRERAGPQVRFLGQRCDDDVVDAMRRCRALILPGVEDFGMTAVEAQAAGRPVIAAGAGGVLETVVDGVTGLLVPPGDIDALAVAMREASLQDWDSAAIRQNADRFDRRHFEAAMRRVVADVLPAGVDDPLVVRADPLWTGM